MARSSLPFAFSIVAALLSGCGDGSTTKRWREDVKLDDGTIVNVERSMTYSESRALGGDAYNLIEKAAELRVPDAPAWQGDLRPLVLYRDSATGQWVLVTITSDCRTWMKNGMPNPPYWEYRTFADGWRATPLSAASVGRERNLLSEYQQKLPSIHVTIEAKKSLDRDLKRIDQTTEPERTFRIVVGTPLSDYC